MPGGGFRTDRGGKFAHVNKPLEMLGSSWVEPQGATVLFEDFLVDVLADTPYVTVTQSGTALTAAVIDGTAGAPTAGHGGWVGGKTDDVDAEIDEVAFGGLGTGAGSPPFAAARAGTGVMVAEYGFVIPTALTARQYYFGWSDDPVEGTGTNGAINITGTYATVTPATDAAGFIFSSLATSAATWKHGSVKTDVDGAMNSAAETGITGVVDCYTRLRTEIDVLGNAYFYASIAGSATAIGLPVAGVGSRALAVNPAIPLLGYASAAATTTTGVEWEIDYCFMASNRF